MSCGLHIYWVNLCPGVACMPTPSVIVLHGQSSKISKNQFEKVNIFSEQAMLNNVLVVHGKYHCTKDMVELEVVWH